MNDQQKEAFLALPLKEQLLAILDGQTYIRSKIDQLEKRQENFEADTRLYRTLREMNEIKVQSIVEAIVDAIRRENASG